MYVKKLFYHSIIILILSLYFSSCTHTKENKQLEKINPQDSSLSGKTNEIKTSLTTYHKDFKLSYEGHSVIDFIPNYCTIVKSFGFDFNDDGISDSCAILEWEASENETFNKVFVVFGQNDGLLILQEDLSPVLYPDRGYNDIQLSEDSIIVYTDLPLYETHLRKFYIKWQNKQFVIVKIIGDFVINGNSYYSSLELESGKYFFQQTMYTETTTKDTSVQGIKNNSSPVSVSEYDLSIIHNGKNLDLGNRFNLY